MQKKEQHKNILLVGKTGAGKSTIANVLLGVNGCFQVSGGLESYTKECKMMKNNLYGIKTKPYIQVIDTPGFMDSSGDDANTIFQIFEMLTYIKEEGLHLILFCLSATEMRCDKGILDSIQQIQTLMSNQVLARIFVIVTQINKLKQENIDAQCQKINHEVPQILAQANLKINFDPIFMYFHGQKNNGLNNLEALLQKQTTFIPDVVKDLRYFYDPNNEGRSLHYLALESKGMQKLMQELANQKQMREMQQKQYQQQIRTMNNAFKLEQEQTRKQISEMQKKFEQEKRETEYQQKLILKKMESDQAFSKQKAHENLISLQSLLKYRPKIFGKAKFDKTIAQFIESLKNG